jgi:hypothetical protein
MSILFEELEYVKAYIDDLLIITKGNYLDHLNKVEQVLLKLEKAGLKVNANKSFFAKGELEYLGYWITRNGIQPLPKKIEAKPFVIHTDASDFQLGAVISQQNKPIAYYSRKLPPAQTRYTTTERELLSIVETLKEFRNILLGHKVIVYTDHKNLTYKNFNTN